MGKIIQLHPDEPQQPQIYPQAVVLIADARKDERKCVWCDADETYLAVVNPDEKSLESIPMCRECFEKQLDQLDAMLNEALNGRKN